MPRIYYFIYKFISKLKIYYLNKQDLGIWNHLGVVVNWLLGAYRSFWGSTWGKLLGAYRKLL
jgi:hypothetical protein